MKAIARAKAEVVAAQAIKEAVSDEVFSRVRYENLIRIEMDPKRERILMVQPDTVTIKKIADQAVRSVNSKMQDLNRQHFAIPLGQILGMTVFGDSGPVINLAIVPIGMAHVNLKSRFEQAGINQVHHMIIMETHVSIRAVVPLVTDEVTVTVETPLTSAVISGDVPANYWNVNLGGTRLAPTQSNQPSH